MPRIQTPGIGSVIIPSVALLALTLDLACKNWARKTLGEGATSQFLPGLLHFNLTSNTGAAFSLGSHNSALMTGLACLLTLLLIFWSAKRELTESKVPLLDRVGLGFLIGGALGNLCDRFLRGRVTDFLEFSFVSFPVFNTADIMIDVGIGLLVIAALVASENKRADEKP